MTFASASKSRASGAVSGTAHIRPQDAIFQALRRDILLGRLRPRERMVEEELTGRFGVGRYVVRAALDELTRIGLVLRRPNRGVVVSDYDPAEIEKLYEMREILQRAAVARIPMPVPEALLRELKEINRRYGDCYARGELEEVAETNAAFHRSLFGACQNQYLADAIEQFWEKTAAVHGYAIGTPRLAAQSYSDHEQMIDSLEKCDRQRLTDLCIQHMRPALEAVLASRRSAVA
jgi:DNA-binding GntR family transcriptional regulator